MTKRSIILGLVCAMALGPITFMNDMVMKGTYLIGNYIPIAVFGSLLLFVLIVNPALKALRFRPLAGKELAVAVAIVLCVCCLPGRGLMHFFTNYQMLPHRFDRVEAGWGTPDARTTLADIRDWARVAENLSGENSPIEINSGLRQQLTAADPEMLASSATGTATLAAINAVIDGPRLDPPEDLRLPRHVVELRARPVESLSDRERQQVNRVILDAQMPTALHPLRLGAVDRAPDRMLADVAAYPDALDGFANGLGTGKDSVSVRDLPWGAWRRSLLFWVPLILTLSILVAGLAFVLHRRWADFECLPYPTVEFARMLLPAEGKSVPAIFHDRRFWLGTLSVFAIHMNNYAHSWWPEVVIPMHLKFDFIPVANLFPALATGGVWGYADPQIYFTAVGFAFFLATDVGLALGLAPWLGALATGLLAGYGVAMTSGHLDATIRSGFYSGSFSAMFLVLLYAGRRYYFSVLRRTFGLRAPDQIEASSVWWARVAMGAFVLFVVQLSFVGVEWQWALAYSLIVIMIFTVVSRLVAEAGAFFIHPHFYPCAMIWGFIGAKAVGVDQLLVLSMISGLLLIDPREAMMPFAATATCLTERVGAPASKTLRWGMVALVLCFVVTVPIVLCWQYQHGAVVVGDGWTTDGVPKFPYRVNSQISNTMDAQGVLADSQNASGLSRLSMASPLKPYVAAFAATFLLVLLFSFLRHRFARWPIHPLIFLMLDTFQSRMLATSFLIGCLLKAAVTHYGGATIYQKLKPLALGLVAGEALAGIITVLIGAIYYWLTGDAPPTFRLMPG